MSHLFNAGSTDGKLGGGGILVRTIAMYYHPGDIVVSGLDYDIVAEQAKNGKVTFAVWWKSSFKCPYCDGYCRCGLEKRLT